jgi:iron complex outermembrane receptor protein
MHRIHTSVTRPWVAALAVAAALPACQTARLPPATHSVDETFGRTPSAGDSLARARLVQFEDMLRSVPGVQVSSYPGGFTVRVRGPSSLVGTGEPLYVLDGQVMQGTVMETLQYLKPSDVARIEVLRDAGSTTYYGSRGANGVIVIALKKKADR